MAYETPLLPSYDYAAEPEPDLRRGDEIYPELDGPLSRPYLGPLQATLYETDLGIAPEYDPLTAPLEEVATREFGSLEAYKAAPTLWDRQAEQAHHWAAERAAVLGGMRRVCEYRARFPRDTDTLQLRIVQPAPSSVDVALAELRQLKTEIEQTPPPVFSVAQPLRTRQYESASTLSPTNKDTGPAVLPPADADSGGLPSANPSLAQEGSRTELMGGGKGEKRERRPLGPVGRKVAEFWRIASLSKRGASRLLDRIKQQAGI